MKLSKRCIAESGITGGELSPVYYKVEGLPDGKRVDLREDERGWAIVRTVEGEEIRSKERYKSADEALEDLNRIIESERTQRG